MTYHLKLTKALSYCGVVTATKEKPDVYIDDRDVADKAVATGYFELVESEESKLERPDPAKLEGMSLKGLKALAAKLGFDTKGLKEKQDFIDIIIGEDTETDDVDPTQA